MQSGKLKLTEIQFFILDEADRLLDTGNLEVILLHHSSTRRVKRVQGYRHCSSRRCIRRRCVASLSVSLCIRRWSIWARSMCQTVHHVVVHVDPSEDYSADKGTGPKVPTDGVHNNDKVGKGVDTPVVGLKASSV